MKQKVGRDYAGRWIRSGKYLCTSGRIEREYSWNTLSPGTVSQKLAGCSRVWIARGIRLLRLSALRRREDVTSATGWWEI